MSLELDKIKKVREQIGYNYFETFSVSEHLGIVFVNIDRSKEYKSLRDNYIVPIIRNTDGVILEYFSHDMDPIFSDYLDEEDIIYQNLIAGDVLKEGKDAYVIDPAHDRNFLIPSGANATLPIATLLAYQYLGKLVKDENSTDNEGGSFSSAKMTRREFLKTGSLFLGSAFTLSTSSLLVRVAEGLSGEPFNFPPHYQNFRRVIVSQGLFTLAREFERQGINRNVAMFYPPFHNKGVAQFLINRRYTDLYFSSIKWLKEIESFKDSFFNVRRYGAKGGSWYLADRIEIR